MSKRSTREDEAAREDEATRDDDRPSRERVREALASVTDPELDRSIVELEYIDGIRFEADGTVHVAFTLPTAWCSPAFAWMMASDSRDVVESLSGVDRCRVELREHMHEREVNHGVNGGIDFAEAFPEAEDGIADLRETLDEKAVLARQYRATEALLAAGLDLEQIALLERSDLDRDIADGRIAIAVPDRGFEVTVPAEPVDRYLEKAAALDRFERSERLFRTPDGDAIDPDDAELVHRRGRLARVNMDGQGGVCDALHESRQSAHAE